MTHIRSRRVVEDVAVGRKDVRIAAPSARRMTTSICGSLPPDSTASTIASNDVRRVEDDEEIGHHDPCADMRPGGVDTVSSPDAQRDGREPNRCVIQPAV